MRGGRGAWRKTMNGVHAFARGRRTIAPLVITIAAALAAHLLAARPLRADPAPLKPFLPLQVSTVPANGDQNPYGLAFVPPGARFGGALKQGEMLISNFNDTSLQGRGS